MCACTAFCCQLQHLRPKCRQHTLRCSGGCSAKENSFVHRIEVLHHRAVRLVVCSLMHALHHRSMTDTNTQQETIRERLGQCLPTRLHCLRCSRMQACNACGQHNLLCGRQQQCRRCKRFTNDCFGHPHGSVAHLFHLCDGFLRLCHWLKIEISCP